MILGGTVEMVVLESLDWVRVRVRESVLKDVYIEGGLEELCCVSVGFEGVARSESRSGGVWRA